MGFFVLGLVFFSTNYFLGTFKPLAAHINWSKRKGQEKERKVGGEGKGWKS